MAKPSLQETETKLYIPDLTTVETRLIALGAKLTAPRVFERNVRYENAAGTLREQGIVVRLRQDTRARLTYKDGGQVENNTISRYEAEVEVSDFDTMDLILAKLGYHPHMIYEKYRTTYELGEAEIVLDELPFGNFIEIEATVTEIERLIDVLKLGDAPRYGNSYVTLFDRVQAALGLDLADLTFANFSGITVPASAFELINPDTEPEA